MARAKAADARKLVAAGIDPVEEKEKAKAAIELEQIKNVTFSEAAEQYITSQQVGWRNEKHRQQWRSTLQNYAYPVIGKMIVRDIDTPHILKILEPIWNEKRETASRVRSRLEKVLGYCTVAKLRTGLNPARWKENLDHLLTNNEKKVKHHASLGYDKIPAFMAQLREMAGVSARTLELCILTALRTTETRAAKWDEIDWASKIWTVPGARMKAGVDHKVPLSDRALDILKGMQGMDDVYVFPGGKPGKPLSNMALLMTLRRMGVEDATTHGMRSTFSQWGREKTNFGRDVVEACLAHTIKDKTERAYMRGTFLDKRTQLMAAWAKYCLSTPVVAANEDNVVSIGRVS
jgi:integrase